ncbi:ArsR/SmtB family transcription factor [Alkalihalobacterium alkalinitrilicum]|uniref:ArsR/SmtB family transcription factor n=1 Tax=Alkalihalobacterium alkalinitrilicum TaxID=427920 RepID=UPI000995737D|nr:winged helix-turn-helix domain-containing protein [Alkalihalobacterium alkalinitrilicum]
MKVTVKFHPIFEFLISLYVFSDKGAHKKMDLGVNWVNAIKPVLSDDFLHVVSNKETRTKLAVIQYYLLSQKVNENESILQLLTQIEEEETKNLIKPAYECTEFKEQIPPDVKDVIPLLIEWYNTYFTTIDEKIFNNLRESVQSAKKALKKKTVSQVVEELTNGIIPPKESSREIVLIPQYHYSPTVLHDKTVSQRIYFYPVDAMPNAAGSPSILLMRKLRALTDENRLKILKYLAKGDRTFSDIQKHIGLAKSTVHHHLIVLRSAGLLSLVVYESQPDQYRFREDGYTGLENLLTDFIT